MLISTAIKEWFFDIQNLSLNTQSYYKRAILNFTLNLSKKYISNVTSVDIRNYLYKYAWHHKNSTVNNDAMALRGFFRFLSENFYIPNIAKDIKKRKQDMPYQPFINKEQYLKILESATQKESDIIKMLANTGLRCSELCGLRPENISPNLSSLRIQGKGGRVRTIPCNQTVREILSRNIHFPKNRKSIYSTVHKAGNRIGINLAPHILRRYFATQMLNAGVSLLILSKILGHSNLHQTEIYCKLDLSFLQGATDVLD